MISTRFFLSIILAGALIAGCDDKKADQPKVDNTPKTPSVNDVKAGMDKAADRTKDAATNAANNTTDAAKNAADTTKDAAANATDAIKTQAADWFAKAQDAVKNNKLDEAKTYIDKLESFKSKLSTEWQTKIDSLQTAYTAAKAKLPTAPPSLNK